jgi:CRP-like cAMP-binding protein
MQDKIIELKKGTILFREGDESQELYIVQQGVVKIYKEANGVQLPLGLVHAGQFVGELAFFDGKPRSATGEAATDIKVIKLEKAELESELSKLPSWLMVLIKSIAFRVREADELVKRNMIVDKEVSEEFKRWK